MKSKLLIQLLIGALALPALAVQARDLKVVSDTAVAGFQFPESAGCDPAHKAIYVSQFVSALKPADKDGKGRISKVGLNGEMLDAQFLPGPGDVLHKPKGIWVAGNRLWVTDIDAVWEFDLETRKGRKLELPGAQFANDVAIKDGALFVSDNRLDTVFVVRPAEFLDTQQAPTITQVARGASTNPNGVYPAQDGSLLLAGMADSSRGLYALDAQGKLTTLAADLGKLDGLYQAADGSVLATDWASGSLFSWSAAGGRHTLAADFKGPADFCAIADDNGVALFAPDLIKGELRLIKLQ